MCRSPSVQSKADTAGAAERVTRRRKILPRIRGMHAKTLPHCHWNRIKKKPPKVDSAQLIRKPRSCFRFIFLVEELRIDVHFDLGMQLGVESEMLGEGKVACDGASQTHQIATVDAGPCWAKGPECRWSRLAPWPAPTRPTTKLGPETLMMANVDGIMETATSKQRRRNDWRFWDGGGGLG